MRVSTMQGEKDGTQKELLYDMGGEWTYELTLIPEGEDRKELYAQYEGFDGIIIGTQKNTSSNTLRPTRVVEEEGVVV